MFLCIKILILIVLFVKKMFSFIFVESELKSNFLNLKSLCITVEYCDCEQLEISEFIRVIINLNWVCTSSAKYGLCIVDLLDPIKAGVDLEEKRYWCRKANQVTQNVAIETLDALLIRRD